MRCLVCLFFMLLVGCQTQSGSFNNPFITPDRVPPPSTQSLTPGMAQPYYQGGPIQPAAPVTGQPTAPPGAVPVGPTTPAGNYTAPSVYGSQSSAIQGQPINSTNPTVPSASPPPGWNSSPQPPSGTGVPYGGQPTGTYTPGTPVAPGAPVSQSSAAGQTVVQTVSNSDSSSGGVVTASLPQRPAARALAPSEWQYQGASQTQGTASSGFVTEPIVR